MSANTQNQTWKISHPVKDRVTGSWRIQRRDGALVGYYATKKLAQRAIDKSPWLN